MDAAAIYVHWAFCPYLCPYCDFAKWAYDERAAERYARALETEIIAAPASAASTVFFGGGTPNAYAPDVVARIGALIRDRFSISPEAEFTTEVNPDRRLIGGFDVLRAGGINRLSIGVQSFDAGELHTLGRRHTAGDVEEAVRRARAGGFANVSIDLMFGVPGQTEESWRRSLDAAIALDVDHVSAYGLTVEEGTPYARWQARDPGAFFDGDREAVLYALAIERLEAAGYEQYEISNFARPGRRSVHNQNYWRNGEYAGFGVGAASYRGGVRSVHTRDRAEYEAAVLAGDAIPGESEALAGDERVGEAVMLALRTREGVDIGVFRERYAFDVLTRYDRVIADFVDADLLVADDRGIHLTVRGRFVANDVCAAFITGP